MAITGSVLMPASFQAAWQAAACSQSLPFIPYKAHFPQEAPAALRYPDMRAACSQQEVLWQRAQDAVCDNDKVWTCDDNGYLEEVDKRYAIPDLERCHFLSEEEYLDYRDHRGLPEIQEEPRHTLRWDILPCWAPVRALRS